MTVVSLRGFISFLSFLILMATVGCQGRLAEPTATTSVAVGTQAPAFPTVAPAPIRDLTLPAVWVVYADPDMDLSLEYPGEWRMEISGGEQISLYPPGSGKPAVGIESLPASAEGNFEEQVRALASEGRSGLAAPPDMQVIETEEGLSGYVIVAEGHVGEDVPPLVAYLPSTGFEGGTSPEILRVTLGSEGEAAVFHRILQSLRWITPPESRAERLADLPGDEHSVFAWGPDGNIAWTAEDTVWGGSPPRYVPRRLAQGMNADRLAWSPDGRRLAFSGLEAGGIIWVVEADAAELQEFPSQILQERSVDRWLDDGSVAFTASCGDGCRTLGVLDVVTGLEAILSSSGAAYHWAPTLDRIAVEEIAWGRYLGLMSPSGWDYARIVDQWDLYQRFLAWNPNGQELLYTQWQAQGLASDLEQGGNQLRLLDVDSGRSWALLPNVVWAAWSPGGGRLAFLMVGRPIRDLDGRIADTDFSPGGTASLWLGVAEPVTPTIGIQALVPCGSLALASSDPWSWIEERAPSWSSDGSRLAYWDADGFLWAIDRDGGKAEPLAEGDEGFGYVAWAPDGERVAFATPKGVRILRLNPLGGEP